MNPVYTVMIAIITASAASAAFASTLPRADGSSIVYHLDNAEIGPSRSLLLILQGSGCDPVGERPWLSSEPPLVAPGSGVLAIEKYGVSPTQPKTGFVDGCSADFWHHDTLQQRVADAVQVIAHLRGAPWWNGKLVIMGGSEGGAIAAMLAPLVPETRAVVIMSSGIGVPVADLIRSAVPPPVVAQLDAALAEARANPTGDKRFAGASYRWWADAARVTPAAMLLQTNVPVLLIHGERDQFAPVATARATRDLIAAAGRRNLTYWEYAGYDHFMMDAVGVDHRPEVLKRVRAWIGGAKAVP
jgi:pimeloyl-ACP methyl ester carboxylesterase